MKFEIIFRFTNVLPVVSINSRLSTSTKTTMQIHKKAIDSEQIVGVTFILMVFVNKSKRFGLMVYWKMLVSTLYLYKKLSMAKCALE